MLSLAAGWAPAWAGPVTDADVDRALKVLRVEADHARAQAAAQERMWGPADPSTPSPADDWTPALSKIQSGALDPHEEARRRFEVPSAPKGFRYDAKCSQMQSSLQMRLLLVFTSGQGQSSDEAMRRMASDAERSRREGSLEILQSAVANPILAPDQKQVDPAFREVRARFGRQLRWKVEERRGPYGERMLELTEPKRALRGKVFDRNVYVTSRCEHLPVGSVLEIWPTSLGLAVIEEYDRAQKEREESAWDAVEAACGGANLTRERYDEIRGALMRAREDSSDDGWRDPPPTRAPPDVSDWAEQRLAIIGEQRARAKNVELYRRRVSEIEDVLRITNPPPQR
jgi:hypothetical protein